MNVILIVVLILCIIISLILLKFFTPNKNDILPEFVRNIKLVQNKEFYDDKKTDTMKYLLAVYPTAKDSFESLSSTELAKFYNSLWFYYNCSAKFDEELTDPDKKKIRQCWQPLPGCGTKYPKLPYSPQGYLFSYKDWVTSWTPWIDSKSDLDPSYFTGSLPGSSMWTWTSGPAPLFMFQRAIYRQVYNPAPPFMYDATVRDKDNKLVKKSIKVASTFADGETPDWKYPTNWWKGYEDNSYVEVTAADEPGMPISGAATWIDGWVGSGIFYFLGKTFNCRNKVDCVFLLAQKMAVVNKTKLLQAYNSIDPYDIVSKLLLTPCDQNPPFVWDSESGMRVNCNWCGGASGALGGLPYDKKGWNDVYYFEPTDWFTWCGESEANHNRSRNAWGITNKCIDSLRFGNLPMSDRVAAQGPFDEAMTWMGVYLGYDTIIERQSSNGTGFWQVEILELRYLPAGVRDRDYSEYIQKVPGKKCGEYGMNPLELVEWRKDNSFMKDFMSKIYGNYSLRDPLDIYNDKKASLCIPGAIWKPDIGWDYNITCKNNISDMYTKLSIMGANTHDPPIFNQCSPDGLGFQGNKMTDSESPPWG